MFNNVLEAIKMVDNLDIHPITRGKLTYAKFCAALYCPEILTCSCDETFKNEDINKLLSSLNNVNTYYVPNGYSKIYNIALINFINLFILTMINFSD